MSDPDSPYQVRLDGFEGPLDLLLHLIKKNEINIYDIPIALVTAQYLEYVSVMKSVNLAVAGEFLVMAATLVQLKAKMLLPVEQGDETDEDGPDPREELVRRLLEYKQFKDAADELDGRERIWREMFGKEPVPSEPVPPKELSLDQVTLFDLLDALQGLLSRVPGQKVLEIEAEHLTVRDRMNVILERLEERDSVTFLSLFTGQQQRVVIAVTFLALLELIRIKVVRVFQGELFGPILVSRGYSLVSEDEFPVDLEGVEEPKGGLPA